ncbi:MAG: phosphoadenosine phosphosulfate reductase family protein [Deltaproteobacteria bacterium]|nr:phosphoadenosine phosphosulfate reductase family protein [Deltaproteobacteria bacterium]
MSDKKTRHILGLSGGKDSAALAIYMRDRVPEMEYIFTDTGKELPECYNYIAQLEAFLGKPVIRLNSERGFDHWLDVYGGLLPSSQMRWCTRQLKIRPFEKYVGDDNVVSYVGIRADENRSGYISTKPNIKPVFPFKEDGITKADVFRILEESGVGIPKYYEWRSRSGCFFCFFQRKSEWAGLLERHPDLFEQAKSYEKFDRETGQRFTWSQSESLEELAKPARLMEIRQATPKTLDSSRTLVSLLANDDSDDDECLVCTL